MTRHYSTRDFFRNTPNALLARYFKARGVLQDYDFTAIKESKVDGVDVCSASDSCRGELQMANRSNAFKCHPHGAYLVGLL